MEAEVQEQDRARSRPVRSRLRKGPPGGPLGRALAGLATVGVAAAITGYALGSAGEASGAGAQSDAYDFAYTAAHSEAFTEQLADGIADGRAEGAKRGATQGIYRGRDEAFAALSEADPAEAQGQRSESESDIGYRGDAAGELDALKALGDIGDGPAGGLEPARYRKLWEQIPVEEKQWAARVAECESGTDPTLTALGGDFRGAFMFTPDAWRTSPNTPGGDPIRYSYLVQAVVAISLKGRDGVRPWPVCGPKALEG